MTIDREAQAVLDDIAAAAKDAREPANAREKLEQARRDTASLARFSAPMPEIAIEVRDIDGRHGAIPVEIYRPSDAPGALIVWFHGGGAIAGSIETHRAPLANLAVAVRCPIASVGYRLAPEARFPVQHEDCLDAFRALAAGAAPVVLGGDSIGGLFATTVARLVRDERAPRIAGQILLYPNTDMRQDRGFLSLDENDGIVMTRASLAYEADTYIPVLADRGSPIGSPLLAADLAGLPPTLLVTCGADPLRDEGIAYGERLTAAGVPLTHRHFDGMIHAFLQTGAVTGATAELEATVRAFLDTLP